MMLFLYKAAVTLAAPAVALALAIGPQRRPLLARFHPGLPRFESRPLWVHACSVGEVNTARPILEAWRDRWPETPLLLTVSTPTAMDLANSTALHAEVAWFPFDHPLVVRRFLRAIRPRALVLIETELWPCVITQTRAGGAPVVLVNGRLSDRQAHAYRRFGAFLRPAAARISAAGMQNAKYAERLHALGTPPERVIVTGNTKFDSAPPELSPGDRAALRKELRIPPEAPVVVFGSTRPGDESLAAGCWRELNQRFPGLVLIVAPRHLERVDEACEALCIEGAQLRSGIPPLGDGEQAVASVILLDTHGELARIYAIADVAVIGGSFYPGVDGHNPIEPAAQGVPAVFGPYMRNFQDPAAALLEAGGAVQAASPGALCGELESLLSDPQVRVEMGRNARRCVVENQGATERTLDLIERTLGPE